MSQHASPDPLSHEVRFRLPLPVVVPLGALLVIGVVTVGMAQILLNVPKEAAVLIAMIVAANILAVCAFIAARPDTARAYWAELVIVATYPFVIGVVLALLGIGEGHEIVAPAQKAGAAAPAGDQVSAANVAFDTQELSFSAGEDVALTFVNDDSSSVQHNIAIYEDDSASKEIFVGETIPGGQEITYSFKVPPKGEYYFQCDVHPSMNGNVTVE